MKVLMINKFLHPNGGSETYIFNLGNQLEKMGHSVEYFGMEHEGRCVGNSAEVYTSDMDFHQGSYLKKVTYPLKTIYSSEARKKIRIVLENFEPDVCHLNNFNYQLTPSIILEIDKWRRKNGKKCKIIFTAHDYQLLCPNHLFYDRNASAVCEKCLNGSFVNCIKNNCIHGSKAKSMVGAAEAVFWKLKNVYRLIDTIICPSEFIKAKFDVKPLFSNKTVMLRNFVSKSQHDSYMKKEYVLYFGRYSEEKGVKTLLKACEKLSNISFVFAGDGPLAEEVNSIDNITNLGFISGDMLVRTIAEAAFSIVPSECYDNCPFAVMESIMYGTVVIGARIGGIPELIKENYNGECFDAGNVDDLCDHISKLWEDKELLKAYSARCRYDCFDGVEEYCENIMEFYK